MRSYTRYAGIVVLVSVLAPIGILQAQAGYGPPTAVVVSGPEVGREAPDFALPWAGKDGVGPIDQWFRLSAQRGKTVVLAFYPKDFTTGCTAEMQTFTQQYGELFGENVVVVGINADSLDTHVRFAASLGVPFQLLTDQGQAVSKKFGSAGDNGYNRRTVYVIDPRGAVSYRDMSFGALDPKAYSRLKDAVKAARSM